MLTITAQSLELFIYETGFAANERRAAHRRVRYRLVGSSSGEHVDPNLEIVHYTQSAPGHQLDPRQIAISPQKRQLWEQRRYLEQSGALVKKDFMLHDSNNWPTISMPARPAIPANPYQHPPIGGGAFAQPPRPPVPPQALYNQPGGPRPGVGPPPPKRARQHPPARMSGAHMPGGPAAEDAVMAEEDTSIGDLLDALSPREISFTRYIQHHEWMEEILMSPYAMHQILPVELGFGLSGDLAELTEGLFDRKTVEDVINGSDVNPEKRAGIDGQKVDELEKRVQKFRENGEMKIAEMKAEHVRKVQELSQPKTFSSLERRLAQVGSDDGSKEAVDDIVREAERLTKAKLTAREDVVLVQKGGLLQGGEENMPENGNMEENQNDDFREFTNLDFFSSTGFEVAT